MAKCDNIVVTTKVFVVTGSSLHREDMENGSKIVIRENIGNLGILPKHRENKEIWCPQLIDSRG